MSESLIIAILGGCVSLIVAIVPKIIDYKVGTAKDIRELKNDVRELKEDNKMNSDMIYQMLDHMATSNNTGQMKRALDQYNQYFRQ